MQNTVVFFGVQEDSIKNNIHRGKGEFNKITDLLNLLSEHDGDDIEVEKFETGEI